MVAPCSVSVFAAASRARLAALIRAFCASMSARIAATRACFRSSSVHKNGYSFINWNLAPRSAVIIRVKTLAVRNATAASSCSLCRCASCRALINASVSPHVHCHMVKRSPPCPTASSINSSTVYGLTLAGAFTRFPAACPRCRSTRQTSCLPGRPSFYALLRTKCQIPCTTRSLTAAWPQYPTAHCPP